MPACFDGRQLRTNATLQRLISLGHTLGDRILAEDVETAAIYELPLTTDCVGMQGCFSSRPIEVA